MSCANATGHGLAGSLPTVTRELSFSTRRTGLPRVPGGLAGLVYPIFLVTVAIQTGFRHDGELTDLAASFLAALLLLIAVPTAWLFSFDFIVAGRFTIIFVGALTSFPLWYLAGRALASGSGRWSEWIRRYVALCIAWTALNLLGFFIVASLFG